MDAVERLVPDAKERLRADVLPLQVAWADAVEVASAEASRAGEALVLAAQGWAQSLCLDDTAGVCRDAALFAVAAWHATAPARRAFRAAFYAGRDDMPRLADGIGHRRPLPKTKEEALEAAFEPGYLGGWFVFIPTPEAPWDDVDRLTASLGEWASADQELAPLLRTMMFEHISATGRRTLPAWDPREETWEAFRRRVDDEYARYLSDYRVRVEAGFRAAGYAPGAATRNRGRGPLAAAGWLVLHRCCGLTFEAIANRCAEEEHDGNAPGADAIGRAVKRLEESVGLD